MANESGTSLSLLQRIRNGDASGWRRVVDLYAPLVHHWCRRWGAQDADVDDLAQVIRSMPRKIPALGLDGTEAAWENNPIPAPPVTQGGNRSVLRWTG